LLGDEWLKDQRAAADPVFWKNVAKSLFIVTRNYCVVNGDNQEWFTEHKKEVDLAKKEVLKNAKKNNKIMTEQQAQVKAEKDDMDAAVKTMRLGIKKIIVESVKERYFQIPGFNAGLDETLKMTNFFETKR